MGRQNTKGKIEFVLSHVYWVLIAMIWYKNILFRCLNPYSYNESKLILWGSILMSSAVGIILGIKKRRNGTTVFVDIATGFGLYTVFTYIDIRKKFIIFVLVIAAILSIAYALVVLCQKIRNKRRFRKIFFRRLAKVAVTSQVLFSIGLLCIMVVFGFGGIFGSTIMNASVKSANESNIEEQTIANNIDTLLFLQEDKWAELTVQEKLNVLQTVANIENRYLGLSTELNVGAANLKEGLVGYYSDNTHEIVINMDSLQNSSAHECLDATCHEAYHGYQHRLIDAYNHANEADQSLLIYFDAQVYQQEFANYTDGMEDYCGYYTQNCEKDARNYANEAVVDYYKRISEYMETNPSEDATVHNQNFNHVIWK